MSETPVYELEDAQHSQGHLRVWKRCKACGEPMYRAVNPKTGAFVPCNRDGTSHFLTCSDPNRFSRK